MAIKDIVYSKQTGEPPVPATVRVLWLPDSSIKPVMYWLPDDSCFDVKHVYECTQLAHLKDKGIGIRFKIRGELIESAEPLCDYLRSQHETYLYFTDNRFCGKNFIDNRYGHAGKEYIPVTLDIFPDGDYEIIYFWAKDKRYMVEKTLAIEPRGSFRAGGVGVRHKVDARLVNADDDECPDIHKTVRREAALYFEVNKWFVSLVMA
jgi:hypothetical protein